jgi:imidazoleglycerol phosphate synthase glutamine amidotransferase subunit HisH
VNGQKSYCAPQLGAPISLYVYENTHGIPKNFALSTVENRARAFTQFYPEKSGGAGLSIVANRIWTL